MSRLGPRVRISQVKIEEGFRVLLTFENGKQREVDLDPYLHGPIFQPIRDDPALFRAVGIEGGTLAWPNGADIDPDVLFYGLTPAWREEQVPS